ncbi:MAG: transcription antitermination factor NusB [Clostridiaceae bacterium]|nr:transcription antitermination factor NusB [Clostridiaceae bacterium]
MTKKRKREKLYIMLFQVDFYHEEDRKEQAELYLERLEEPDATKKAKAEVRESFYQIMEHLQEIDSQIAKKAHGWEISRLAKADLSVLRLGVYEILFDGEVPDGVAINEAVELAKRYGGDKSYRFVNGILGSIAREKKQAE